MLETTVLSILTVILSLFEAVPHTGIFASLYKTAPSPNKGQSITSDNTGWTKVINTPIVRKNISNRLFIYSFREKFL